MTARRVAALLACTIVALALPLNGCGDNTTPTSPTDTTPTETAVDPTTSLTFTGTLSVNSAAFYSFDVTQYGTVNLTLQNVGGVSGVPESVWVGLGIGVPDGTDCSTTTSTNTQAGSGPHVSSVLSAGTYCARIYDVGNLASPTPFNVLIAHP
jgi:hypothetical protein